MWIGKGLSSHLACSRDKTLTYERAAANWIDMRALRPVFLPSCAQSCVPTCCNIPVMLVACCDRAVNCRIHTCARIWRLIGFGPQVHASMPVYAYKWSSQGNAERTLKPLLLHMRCCLSDHWQSPNAEKAHCRGHWNDMGSHN